MAEPRVDCRTPNPDRSGITRIPEWKFDAVRATILAVLAEGPLAFSKLKDAVGGRLSSEDLEKLGSLGWHVTTVKLELEVRGEIVRLEDTPQRIALP
ncbi:MAG: hypothetical protein AAF415_07800 [Pseudomonadota bacterium]